MQRTILFVLAFSLTSVSAFAGDAAKKQTIAYVQKLQTSTGGFTAVAAAPNIRVVPTLRATSAAVRALHYFGGEVPNRDACVKFVEACYHPESGGFGDMPNGKPDVVTTAVGLMAVTALKLPKDRYAAPATKYLNDHAKTFEEIRIAAAGLESVKTKVANEEKWVHEVVKLQNKDGSYGKGAGVARDSASSVVTLLRLGTALPVPNSFAKLLDNGQRQNGGWGKADEEIASDLETTYRVMRCYMMLKTQPKHAEGVRSFIAKCRNADGGFGVAPGQPSSVNGTYFAASVLHWLKD